MKPKESAPLSERDEEGKQKSLGSATPLPREQPSAQTGLTPCPYCASTECLQMARFVKNNEKHFSVSLLQRRFRWGYTHAEMVYAILVQEAESVPQIHVSGSQPQATEEKPKSDSAAPTAPQEQPKESELTAAIERLRKFALIECNPLWTRLISDIETVCNAASLRDRE